MDEIKESNEIILTTAKMAYAQVTQNIKSLLFNNITFYIIITILVFSIILNIYLLCYINKSKKSKPEEVLAKV